jgi:hypothetical protein
MSNDWRTYRKRAFDVQHEWLVNFHGDVCLRPFLEDGTMETRRPFAHEFVSPPVAIATLQNIESSHREIKR